MSTEGYKPGRLVIVAGVMAAGKSYIMEKLREGDPSLPLATSRDGKWRPYRATDTRKWLEMLRFSRNIILHYDLTHSVKSPTASAEQALKLQEALATAIEMGCVIDCLLVIARPDRLSERLEERRLKRSSLHRESANEGRGRETPPTVTEPRGLTELCEAWIHDTSSLPLHSHHVLDSSERNVIAYDISRWTEARGKVFGM